MVLGALIPIMTVLRGVNFTSPQFFTLDVQGNQAATVSALIYKYRYLVLHRRCIVIKAGTTNVGCDYFTKLLKYGNGEIIGRYLVTGTNGVT
jgi:putative heme iron utilization protein